jgi:hypothetical protein
MSATSDFEPWDDGPPCDDEAPEPTTPLEVEEAVVRAYAGPEDRPESCFHCGGNPVLKEGRWTCSQCKERLTFSADEVARLRRTLRFAYEHEHPDACIALLTLFASLSQNPSAVLPRFSTPSLGEVPIFAEIMISLLLNPPMGSGTKTQQLQCAIRLGISWIQRHPDDLGMIPENPKDARDRHSVIEWLRYLCLDRPCWDGERLLFRGCVVKDLRKHKTTARYLIAIFDEFELEGWNRCVRIPSRVDNITNARRRLQKMAAVKITLSEANGMMTWEPIGTPTVKA